jgi:prepilin signal peptidase PulO-like enzyme (type II secretory pathway)
MFTALALVVLGLIFGSFINALIWRVHEQEAGEGRREKGKNLSILNGRSQCPHCGHELAAKDLVPVLSWLFLKGKCRYCGQPVSLQYPVVEAATAAWFLLSYFFWPGGVFGVGEWVLIITWLAVSVGLIALAVYDFLWQLLPNRILYPTFLAALYGRLTYILVFSPHILHDLGSLILSILVASGLFWLLFHVSDGKWIGYGDVRLGLVTGTVLASPLKSFLMIFTASVLGTIFVVPELLSGRKQLVSKIPFGPFLIMATALTLLFGQQFIDWYKHLMA